MTIEQTKEMTIEQARNWILQFASTVLDDGHGISKRAYYLLISAAEHDPQLTEILQKVEFSHDPKLEEDRYYLPEED